MYKYSSVTEEKSNILKPHIPIIISAESFFLLEPFELWRFIEFSLLCEP